MTSIGSQNKMLFMLATLACGQKESTPMTPHRIPLSDTSDDETTLATPQAKEIVVARRRRRPIKKRRSSSLTLLGSSIRPGSPLLEARMGDSNNSLLRLKIRAHENSRNKIPAVQRSNSVPQTVHEEMPSLVSDDAGWKKIHAPLELPCFLPCPAVALKNVKSIDLRIQERWNEPRKDSGL